ncbi:hypothetical protein HY251_16855 [bacterium]|nr:hypothetical protein [bacterium]
MEGFLSITTGAKTDLTVGSMHPEAIGDFVSSNQALHVWVRLGADDTAFRVFLVCDEMPSQGPRIDIDHFRVRLRTRGGVALSPASLESVNVGG